MGMRWCEALTVMYDVKFATFINFIIVGTEAIFACRREVYIYCYYYCMI